MGAGSWVWIVLGIVAVCGFFGAFDGNDTSANSTPPSSYRSSTYDDYDTESARVSEPENPYDEGSGHSAGYEWAEENDVSDCGGNSQSFIEGCEEYLSEQEDYDSQGDHDSGYESEEDY